VFTGIIQETGRVAALEKRGGDLVLTLEAPVTAPTLGLGSSVAVNGCCLTAVKIAPPVFTVEAVPETLSRTTFGGLKVGDRVNLELPVKMSDLLGGHLVSGHVDGLAQVRDIRAEGGGSRWTLGLPKGLMKYVVEKGSITLDGISLTVAAIREDEIEVALIPHTLEVTNLGGLKKGDRLHVEADLLAKHLEKLTIAFRQDNPHAH
jgi:riboflavin synthase